MTSVSQPSLELQQAQTRPVSNNLTAICDIVQTLVSHNKKSCSSSSVLIEGDVPSIPPCASYRFV